MYFKLVKEFKIFIISFEELTEKIDLAAMFEYNISISSVFYFSFNTIKPS